MPVIVSDDVPTITVDDVVREVEAITSMAPVIVKVLKPLIIAVPAPVVEVVIEVKERDTSIVNVPPCSIVIVLPTVIVPALTIDPFVINV